MIKFIVVPNYVDVDTMLQSSDGEISQYDSLDEALDASAQDEVEGYISNVFKVTLERIEG